MSVDIDYVKWVQRSMNRLEHGELVVNGVISDHYREVIAYFQDKHFKAPTGQVDSPTQDDIIAENHQDPVYVEWIQKALQKVGNGSLAVTKSLDSPTTAAITAFQKKKSLNQDGWVGSKTEKALLLDSTLPPPGAYFPGPPKPPKPGPKPPKYDPVTNEQVMTRWLKRLIGELKTRPDLHPDVNVRRRLLCLAQKLLTFGYDQKYLVADNASQYIQINRGDSPPLPSPEILANDAYEELMKRIPSLRLKPEASQYALLRGEITDLYSRMVKGMQRIYYHYNFLGYEDSAKALVGWLDGKREKQASIYYCFQGW